MNIAGMRSKITIEKKTITTDTIGNQTESWVTFHTCHARANKASGGEVDEGAQPVDRETVSFVVRYCSALADLDKINYRISFNEKTYDITDIDDFMFKHESLKITAEREI